jgi:hypothetical protein
VEFWKKRLSCLQFWKKSVVVEGDEKLQSDIFDALNTHVHSSDLKVRKQRVAKKIKGDDQERHGRRAIRGSAQMGY